MYTTDEWERQRAYHAQRREELRQEAERRQGEYVIFLGSLVITVISVVSELVKGYLLI